MGYLNCLFGWVDFPVFPAMAGCVWPRGRLGFMRVCVAAVVICLCHPLPDPGGLGQPAPWGCPRIPSGDCGRGFARRVLVHGPRFVCVCLISRIVRGYFAHFKFQRQIRNLRDL